MAYAIKYRVVGDAPPFTVDLYDMTGGSNILVDTHTIGESNILNEFYTPSIDPYKQYKIIATDAFNNSIDETQIYYERFDLTFDNDDRLGIYFEYSDSTLNYYSTEFSDLFDIPKGEMVTIRTADTQENFNGIAKSFSGWRFNSTLITENPYSFEMLDNIGFDCIAVDAYKLIIKNTQHIKVDFTYKNKTSVNLSPQQTHLIAENSNIQLKATPNQGFQFLYWDFGGGQTSSNNPHTFNIGTSNKTVNTVFESISLDEG